MKKIFSCVFILSLLLSGVSFAAYIDDMGATLSNGVVGAYTVDTDPGTAYSLSTAHTQGNKIYASTSEDSLLYYKTDDVGPLTSSDLFSKYTAGGFVSAADGYTAVGEAEEE